MIVIFSDMSLILTGSLTIYMAKLFLLAKTIFATPVRKKHFSSNWEKPANHGSNSRNEKANNQAGHVSHNE